MKRREVLAQAAKRSTLIPITRKGFNMVDTAAEVLIVEDDVQIQKLLSAILSHDGVSSKIAGDGKAACDLLDSTNFDAIVLDLMLPRMNGFDVLRHLSIANPAMLERTVIITGASERLYRNSPQIRQTRALLRKPFDVAKLQQEVAAACAVHH